MRDRETKIRNIMIFMFNSISIMLEPFVVRWAPLGGNLEDHFNEIRKAGGGEKTSTEMVYEIEITDVNTNNQMQLTLTPTIKSEKQVFILAVGEKNKDSLRLFSVPLKCDENHLSMVNIHDYIKDMVERYFNKVHIVTSHCKFEFTKEEYEELTTYIRKEKRNTYLQDIIGNCSEIEGLSEQHIASYFDSTGIRETAGDDFDDIIESRISGEDEYYALQELMSKYGIKKYLLTSNIETQDETTNEVIMTPEDIEKLEEVMREKEDYDAAVLGPREDTINIYDINDESVCYFYVDKYEVIDEAI